MEKHIVICIGRQFGSGGQEIGQGLANRLGIPLYDKEILKKAAEESGIVEELFERAGPSPKAQKSVFTVFLHGKTRPV